MPFLFDAQTPVFAASFLETKRRELYAKQIEDETYKGDQEFLRESLM